MKNFRHSPGRNLALVGIFCVSLWGCASTARFTTTTKSPEPNRFRGLASYYGREFAGRFTASGEIYDPMALTAAHRSLPFGTRLRVTHVQNQRSVIVRINDRGPHLPDRILDLSEAAAQALDMLHQGVAEVECEILSLPQP